MSARLTTALTAVLLFGLSAPAAQAAAYNFTGVGVDLDITTGAPDNGGFDITNVTGTVLGVPVTLAGGDPGAGGAISPGGLFICDNILYPTLNPVFDIDGLLVQIGQDSYANLGATVLRIVIPSTRAPTEATQFKMAVILAC